MSFYKKYSKRGLDIVVSVLALVIFSPVLLLSALLIKLENHGPILFCQERIGKGSNLFKLIKLRTMLVDERKEGLQFTPGDKQRITKIGNFLRKTKIDELCTLVNVLKGEMSLIGPRPEVPEYSDLYQGENKKILSIRPGITDFASIKYRDEENLLSNCKTPERVYRDEILPDKLKLNLHYLKNISFRQDISILLRTIKAVLSGK